MTQVPVLRIVVALGLALFIGQASAYAEEGKIDPVAARTELSITTTDPLVYRLIVAVIAVGILDLGLVSYGLGRWFVDRGAPSHPRF